MSVDSVAQALKTGLSTSATHVTTPVCESRGKRTQITYSYEGVYKQLLGNVDKEVDALIEDLAKAHHLCGSSPALALP